MATAFTATFIGLFMLGLYVAIPICRYYQIRRPDGFNAFLMLAFFPGLGVACFYMVLLRWIYDGADARLDPQDPVIWATIAMVTAWIFFEAWTRKRRIDDEFDARLKQMDAKPFGRYAWVANGQTDSDGRRGALVIWYRSRTKFLPNREFRGDGFYVTTTGEADMSLTRRISHAANSEFHAG